MNYDPDKELRAEMVDHILLKYSDKITESSYITPQITMQLPS